MSKLLESHEEKIKELALQLSIKDDKEKNFEKTWKKKLLWIH